MPSVQDFIFNASGKQKAILEYLDAIITENPRVISKIRYKVPFYYLKSWICYLIPRKDGSVDLSFIRGNELSNEDGLWQARDRKQVKSLSFFDINEIPVDAVNRILHETFLLDEISSKASKKKKTKKS